MSQTNLQPQQKFNPIQEQSQENINNPEQIPADSSKPEQQEQAKPAIIHKLPTKSRLNKQNQPQETRINEVAQHYDEITVAQHYDEITKETAATQNIQKRNVHEAINIREFNNWVKSVFIRKNCPKNSIVLDLACGKGGDLFKYKENEINEYVGIDISRESLVEAQNRYNNVKGPEVKFNATFIHMDATTHTLYDFMNIHPEIGIKLPKQYDLISCQFALHYSFENEKKANTFMKNCSDLLKVGGHFICTVPDGYVLVRKLEKYGKNFGNQFYNVDFVSLEDDSAQEPDSSELKINPSYNQRRFGVKYLFTLKDSVDHCAEYLIHPTVLKKLADGYNLRLIEDGSLNFHDFYMKFKQLAKAKLDKIGQMTHNEWDSVYIYRTFAFEKLPTPQKPDSVPAFKNPIDPTFKKRTLEAKDILTFGMQ